MSQPTRPVPQIPTTQPIRAPQTKGFPDVVTTPDPTAGPIKAPTTGPNGTIVTTIPTGGRGSAGPAGPLEGVPRSV